MDYRLPDSDTPVLVQGIARVQGAQAPDAADLFLEWSGLDEVAWELGIRFQRLPARSGLEGDDAPVWMSEATRTLRPVVVPADSLARHLETWLQRWNEDVRSRGARVF